jgi:hypothetical protein
VEFFFVKVTHLCSNERDPRGQKGKAGVNRAHANVTGTQSAREEATACRRPAAKLLPYAIRTCGVPIARRVQYIIPVYYYYYAIAYSTFCWSTMSTGTRRGALHVCLPSLSPCPLVGTTGTRCPAPDDDARTRSGRVCLLCRRSGPVRGND